MTGMRLQDYRPPAFAVDTVALHFDLHPSATRVRATLALRRAAPGPLWLDMEALDLRSVALDGAPLPDARLRRAPGGIEILDPPDQLTLETETAIDPAANTGLSGLYRSAGGLFTQCEAEGFRRITPFPDRPDVMARYSVTLEADRALYPVLLSNGNRVAGGACGEGRHWARWEDPHPKPSYLFALVAADLRPVRDRFVTRSGREVALAIWVRAGDEPRCGHAMRALKAAMRWDEERYGLEYDLDIFNIAAVPDFNMGAMENKGLNIFNTRCILASPDTATDADHQGVETVVAHEYFHNWTGNRITCRDWFQLSLKEGLTVFRDQQFGADRGGAATKRIAEARALRARQFPEDAGPLAHPVRPDSYEKIDNFYTATVYEKGAELVRMIHTLVGEAAFQRGMAIYVRRHDNGAATIEDFLAAMRAASARVPADFLHWYDQAGTPELAMEGRHDPVARRYELVLRQHTAPTPRQPGKRPLPIPVAMALLGADGAALPIRLENEPAAGPGARVLLLDRPEARFVFEDVAEPPVPSLLRGFSAPVRLSGLSHAQLRFLAAHDDDPFVAWDSGQQYAIETLLAHAAARGRGETPPPDPGLLEIAAAALGYAERDPAFAAEILGLPGEATLADRMKPPVDPGAIHAAREAARAAIGRALESRLQALHDRLGEPDPQAAGDADAPTGRAIGRRALRNACLSLLGAARGDGIAPLALERFRADQGMTDTLAALSVLCATNTPERDEALAAFHARWRADDLVLDKWFAVQAGSPVLGTAARVAALAARPEFRLDNPNRARSLLGAFAHNQARFHDPSGAGYRLLAEQVAKADRVNPQLAARLVPPLGAWRRYGARGEAMRAALRTLLDTPELSAPTREMAARAAEA